MAKIENSGVRTRRGGSSGARSDEDLVLAIAGARDREAFLELFARHQQAAYNLACHVTGSRTLGEEAVQEAMLRLWTSAKTYRPEGNARAWLLRIVAREALRSVKAQRRHRRGADVDLDRQAAGGEEARSAGGKAADRELLAALHGQLDRLEPAQRSLLALYYSGGLSQREIAEALDLTQQTVSNKLNETLATLRRGLAQAGFAAAAPLLETGALSAALGSTYEVPAGLAGGLSAKLGRVADVSQRVAAAKGAGALVWAGCLLAVAAAGGGAWWLAQPPESKAPASAVAKAPPALDEEQDQSEAPAADATPDDAPLRSAMWDFSRKPIEDFAIVSGKWSWKETGKGGYMEVPGTIFVVLPFKTRARPMLVEMEVTPFKVQEEHSFGAYWINDLPDRYVHLERKVFKGFVGINREKFIEHHYVFGRYVVNIVENQLSYVSRYSKPYPGNCLVVSCGNSKLYRIALREILPEEIPAFCRDPETQIPGLTRERRAYPDQVLRKEP